MKHLPVILICLLSFNLANSSVPVIKPMYALVIHGGAGVMDKDKMSAERQQEYLKHLDRALATGDSILRTGGTATDAVVSVVSYLENCPLFNAGKGAVFTHKGRNELDVSIMDGATLKAGALAGVTRIKNPIKAARLVMERSAHVMISGKGTTQFAREQQLELVRNRYFKTRERYQSFKQLRKELRKSTVADKHGTVGCVALDQHGNLVAGTSTGGMTNKKYGRIGDTPVIGAGTWADNRTCAVSCTGHGEYFIRQTIARDVAAHMEYLGMNLNQAGARVIEKLTGTGGTGGFIALDAKGNITMPFNTSGMFRGYLKSTGEKEIAIFGD